MRDPAGGQPENERRVDWFTLLGPYLGLLLVLALFSYLTWERGQLHTFLSIENLQLMTVHASVTATVAVGMTLIMISGGIDLSVGYVVSLVTVTTALTYRLVTPVPGLAEAASGLAIGAGLLTGALAGLGNGLIITRLKIVPFVATLGMMGMARGLAQFLAEGQPVRFPSEVYLPGWVDALSSIYPYPEWLIIGWAPWSVLALACGAGFLLRYTVLGRHCFALGSSERCAHYSGIPVERTRLILYTLAGLITGWAGIIQTARSRSGQFNVAPGLELEVIAAVVIGGGSLTGGVGTVSGTLVGCLLLQVLANGCSKLNMSNDFRFIVIGAIVVAVAALNSWRQRGEGVRR